MNSYYYEIKLDTSNSNSMSISSAKFSRDSYFGTTAMYRDADLFILATGMHWGNDGSLTLECYIHVYVNGGQLHAWDNFMSSTYTSFLPSIFAVNRNNPTEKVKRVYAYAAAYNRGSWDQ